MPRYVKDRMGCLRAFQAETGVERLKDLDLPRASAWLTTFKERGLGARSVNRRYAALKQFGLWLVKTRRVQFDPFDGLKPLNEAEDRRHVRRALTPEEAERLLEAARTRPLSWTVRGKRVEPKSLAERLRLQRLGEIRALIYAIALGTGLRKGEIRRLRWCDVDLRGRAGDRDGRLGQVAQGADGALELGAGEAAEGVPARGRLPHRHGRPGRGVPEHADVPPRPGGGRDRAEGRPRIASSDFHALRTTFVSWLAMTGAHPKVAQMLARHASIETTMERYTDLALMDTKGTVEKLPAPSLGEPSGKPLSQPRVWNRRG